VASGLIIMLTKRQKTTVIKDFAVHGTDTGSVQVQIAMTTKQIAELADHLKKHKKDNHSRRGLLKMVSKRKKLLGYLSDTDEKSYEKVIKKLGLKK